MLVKLTPVLAYILLFDFTDDDSRNFRSCQTVNMDDLHILNLVMFQNCKIESTDAFALQDFVRTLREMSNFFSSNISNFFSDNISRRNFEMIASLPIEPHLKVKELQKYHSLCVSDFPLDSIN